MYDSSKTNYMSNIVSFAFCSWAAKLWYSILLKLRIWCCKRLFNLAAIHRAVVRLTIWPLNYEATCNPTGRRHSLEFKQQIRLIQIPLIIILIILLAIIISYYSLYIEIQKQNSLIFNSVNLTTLS